VVLATFTISRCHCFSFPLFDLAHASVPLSSDVDKLVHLEATLQKLDVKGDYLNNLLEILSPFLVLLISFITPHLRSWLHVHMEHMPHNIFFCQKHSQKRKSIAEILSSII
jgi:hypothetical protein